jgi:hypothetical protein
MQKPASRAGKSWAVCTAAFLCLCAASASADTTESDAKPPIQQSGAAEQSMPPPAVDAPLAVPDTKLPFSLQAQERHRAAVHLTDNRFFLSEESRRLLSRFKLELVVDRSLSMGERDCPGHQTRWQWCGSQAEDLARAIAPYSKDGVTITSFAWRYEVCENASAETIAHLFRRLPIAPGTKLASPLKDRLEHYFENRGLDGRPLLLAVITDGVPSPMPEPLLVRHALAKAVKKVKTPGEVTVVFLQIGKFDFMGRAYLNGLEKSFGSSHFNPPFVQTVSFKEIEAVGLGNALVEAVVQRFSP